ncbi:MurR/RpiR family transcriptional regulator [Ruminococcus sp. OA3]|uniref:MurR/RpiR family transcriptional regulator n=1 Tax=Ruminococcus sp. OA3 TaxID=2914164 RepID=UPI001F0537B2|nr:MurR/RpiR family transcriptional regulator [Ruminococcus sp. OA3]MCH1982806.1 MurR/RpiR family transcriptional regulator [Ruminococcus sp. OA3]
MKTKNHVLHSIEKGYQDLRPSEKKAADYITDHLEEVRKLSLDKLAKSCKVSQPTILRMLKALGYEGYKAFQYDIVEGMAGVENEENTVQAIYGYHISEHDGTADIPEKIVATTSGIIERNLKCISVKTFQKAVEAIINARIIDIYSVENSNTTANDLMTKLLYLGLNCRHFDDNYLRCWLWI